MRESSTLESLPRYFAERDLVSSWKYLADWLLLVRRARLYHPLERPCRATISTRCHVELPMSKD